MKPHAQCGGSTEVDPIQLRADLSPEEHKQRLAYDVDTVLQLQLHQWSDEAWEPVAEALAEYGWAVMTGWLHKRTIFREMRTIGRPLEECPVDWLDGDTIIGLANETVAKALNEFKRVLQQRKWDAARGASLATYFVGQCKFQFSNVYRNWLRAEREHRETTTPWDPSLRARVAVNDSETSSGLAEILDRMSPKAARVFTLKAEGYSYQQIAELVPGMKNAKAVENLVTRERARWTRNKAG